ncbi:DUF6414 family protein [Rathayibacter sp. AY1A3]|uniref:DUF6414 family protein n=1 Tax=Rathayibacter sp. AY1A3 TaxID=2080521 RepID=UPI000CE7A406|nr:DUF6414 family protein [Rathayibacter sp. AY1A3]PPF38749.1 hypothetical protein C5C10_03530 [Rathayibacter sp. AY1A3]
MIDKSKISAPLVKVVYFDEESASDLLDITAGGKETSSKESARERTAEVEAKAGAKAAAKFNWLPFFGGSAEAGAAASATALGRSILNKTLSNTILTDYLGKVHEFQGVERLENFTLSAPSDSAAYMKMFTPYLAMLKIDELPVNLAELDKALLSAKGYYELLGQTPDGSKLVLRFNIEAFRNNYGLVDLGRMKLVFDGVRVGKASERSLAMSAEMNPNSSVTPVDALAIVDGSSEAASDLLDVYDVILAGVEYAG